MTDEAKVEFINETTEKICDWCASEQQKIKQAIKEALEKGLTEGSKITESHLLENWCRNEDDYCPHLKQLEKENKSLGERVLQLEKDKGKLIDENRELKAQVEEYEKMLKYLN